MMALRGIPSQVVDIAMGQLGVVIQGELQRLRWSQNHLAREAGVAIGTVSKVIRGLTRPDYDTVKKLAAALNIDAQRLFDALDLDILAEEHKRRFDTVPPEQIEAFMASLRGQLAQPDGKTLYKKLNRFLNRQKPDDS